VYSIAGIPFAEEAVKLQPKYPFGHYLLELLYFDTGETVRAIPELETALRLAPQEPQFYFELGMPTRRPGASRKQRGRGPPLFVCNTETVRNPGPPRTAKLTIPIQPARRTVRHNPSSLDGDAGNPILDIHDFVAKDGTCFVTRNRRKHHTKSDSKTHPSKKSRGG
jgi:tetratricopeptide (TPR) repeat protein